MASPTKKTSLPSVPVCQPVTENVKPFGSVPTYQSVNAEIVRTSPDTHASRTPQLPAAGVVRSGRGAPALGRRPGGAGWLRRLHRRSMGKKAHRRARGRALSEDIEAVQDVEAQVDESLKARSLPAPLPLDDAGFVEFAVAGADVSGESRCSECGYGAVVRRACRAPDVRRDRVETRAPRLVE